MKRLLHIILLAAATLSAAGASAQLKTSYFMENSIQRLDMNAALIPERGFVTIPVIGNFGVENGSNAFSINKFLFPNPDGNGLVTFMHGSVNAEDFLNGLRNNNHLEQSIRTSIFSIGGYTRSYFWSFGLNLRSETTSTMPKEFFRLAKEFQPGRYDLQDFNVSSDNYLEFAFGAAFPIHVAGHPVTLGARAKILVGAAQAALNVEHMQVTINELEWRAELEGEITGNVAGMDFSNLAGRKPIQDVYGDVNWENFSPSRINSWGLAFDLGAETKFLDDRLKVSLGLNDLGFVSWGSKSAINGRFEELVVSFKGYDFDKEEADFDTPKDVIINVTDPRGFARMLTATLNIGGEYNFLENRIGLGLLSQTRFYGNYTSSELTVSANFRPLNWLSASLSHSLLHNKIGAFGFALNLHPSWINFFVGLDYIAFNYAKYNNIIVPRNLNSMNLYVGLAVPILKPKADGWNPLASSRRR